VSLLIAYVSRRDDSPFETVDPRALCIALSPHCECVSSEIEKSDSITSVSATYATASRLHCGLATSGLALLPCGSIGAASPFRSSAAGAGPPPLPAAAATGISSICLWSSRNDTVEPAASSDLIAAAAAAASRARSSRSNGSATAAADGLALTASALAAAPSELIGRVLSASAAIGCGPALRGGSATFSLPPATGRIDSRAKSAAICSDDKSTD
jgi:hypothetical protein